jgi:type IX secretion system PorP/SprF family membrane protein
MRMMKRYFSLLFVGLFLCAPFISSAQQEPKWNHYMFNDFFYNPGSAGSRGKISSMLIHRYQWVNLPDNASPRTTVLSVHAPAKFLHGGLGLMVNTDKDFFNETSNFRFAYAYRTDWQGGELGFGAYFGGIQSVLDGTKFKPENPNDPLLINTSATALAIDAGFGLHYISDRLYVNLSANRLNNPKIRYSTGNAALTYQRNLFLSAGYTIPLGDIWSLTPSTLLKSNLSAFQADVNLMATYKGKFWSGLGYSSGDAVVVLLGANLGKHLRVGYSYDYNLSGLSRYNDGSHEIFVGYDFTIKFPERPKVIIRSPRFM